MKLNLVRLLQTASLLALSATAACAQDGGALVDALVKKGVLSAQEAEDIRADLVKDFAATPAGKLNISNHITQLKLYGDARWRYQWDEGRSQRPVNGNQPGGGNGTGDQTVTQRERNRYRIRIGAEYQFTDRFKAGWELSSNPQGDSGMQTVGNAYGKFAINTSLLFLSYQPTDWVTLTVGKQRNPFYTPTELIWDADINPEGGSEQFVFKVNDCLTVGLTAGQFIYADNTESNDQGIFGGVGTGNTDVWVFEEQIPIIWKPNKCLSFTFVPGILTYMAGASQTGDVAFSTGNPSFQNINGADNLNILQFAGEVKYNLNTSWLKTPIRAFWEFGYNIDGKQRVQDTYLYQNNAVAAPPAGFDAYRKQNYALSDGIAWDVGAQIGENKKKGDWSFRAEYRVVGVGAIDPNTTDSDWANGTLNQQGIKLQGVYNFTDFITGSVTYSNTFNYKENLYFPTGSAAGPGGVASTGTLVAADLAPYNTTNVLQVDLNWKF